MTSVVTLWPEQAAGKRVLPHYCDPISLLETQPEHSTHTQHAKQTHQQQQPDTTPSPLVHRVCCASTHTQTYSPNHSRLLDHAAAQSLSDTDETAAAAATDHHSNQPATTSRPLGTWGGQQHGDSLSGMLVEPAHMLCMHAAGFLDTRRHFMHCCCRHPSRARRASRGVNRAAAKGVHH